MIVAGMAMMATTVAPAAAADEPEPTYQWIIEHETAPGEAPSFDVVETTVDGALGLMAAPDVAGVELDGFARLMWEPTDPHYVDQWEHHVTGIETVWDTTRGSEDTVIAVLDSGVVPGPEFGDRLLGGVSFIDDDPHHDPLGHGTSVAGVAAAAANNDIGGAGVCSECTILPVQVALSNGSVPWSAAAEGIVWAVDQGADILNLSFGSPSNASVMRSAIEYALSRDVIVIAAAGNYGTDSPIYPAAYEDVISVGAHDENHGRYSWSSHGTWVDMAAPGCARSVTSSGTGVVCGTSFATPWTAGAAALLLDANGTMSPGAIESAFESTTIDLDWVETGAVDATTLLNGPSPAVADDGPRTDFTDVERDAFYEEAVAWMVADGITTGTSRTTFSPDDHVTRGQLATFLHRFAGEPTGAPAAPFTDTDPAAYYADGVNWMVEQGITNGTGPNTFSPNDAVTRGQLAAFLHRYAGSPEAADEASFTDVARTAFFAAAVDYLVSESITTGTSPTTFSPDSAVTRGQLATFLWRFAGEPIV